jgi:hypothetical protein
LKTVELLIIILAIMLPACGKSGQINPDTLNKLDTRLQLLYEDTEGKATAPEPAGHDEDGENLYSVIIYSDNADHLREAGLKLHAVIGPVVTARLTRAEILAAARLATTQSIQADSAMNFPQNDG